MAIDVKKERRLNDMNALAESIKLGTELRRMDESIPTAEKIADWDGARIWGYFMVERYIALRQLPAVVVYTPRI